MVAKPVSAAVDDCKRWRLTGADWSLFRDLCCSELSLTAAEGSNNAVNQFTAKLISAAERAIPKTHGKLKMRHEPWFNEDCKSAIRNRRAALKQFLKNLSQSNLESVRLVRAKARRTMRESKRDSWRSYISKLNSNTPMTKVWEMVKRISGKSQPSTICWIMTIK
jgi:hypothetical protein